ncbi:hypothetical protein MTO96_010341 [Rhipicephalus appendiculatus]
MDAALWPRARNPIPSPAPAPTRGSIQEILADRLGRLAGSAPPIASGARKQPKRVPDPFGTTRVLLCSRCAFLPARRAASGPFDAALAFSVSLSLTSTAVRDA